MLSWPIIIPDLSLNSICTPAALEDKKVFLSPPYHEYFIGLICSNYWSSTQCVRLITRRKKSRLITLTDTVYLFFFLVLLPKVGCQLPTETYRMLRGSNILLKGFVLFHGHLADN